MKRLIICILLLPIYGHCVVSIARAESDEVSSAESTSEGEEQSKIIKLAEETLKEYEIELEAAALHEVNQELELQGEVVFNEDRTSHLYARFPGVVKKVVKNLNDTVQQGDLLAVIESNEGLTNYEVKSEISGRVVGRNIAVGELVKDDREIFTLSDLATVWVSAVVYPSQLTRIKVGNIARIFSEAEDLKSQASVVAISADVNRATRTGLVRLIVKNENQEWIPGTFVKVAVATATSAVEVAVPVAAVVRLNGEESVFVKTSEGEGDSAFEARAVKVGKTDSTYVEIVRGLAVGEIVVTRNAFVLKSEIEKPASD